MNKSKKAKGKKNAVQEVEPLDPNTRVVTLSLILERSTELSSSSWDSITKKVTVATHLCGETHVTLLSHVTTESNDATGPSTSSAAVPPKDDDGRRDCLFELALVKRRVDMKNMADVYALVNGVSGNPHHVELYVVSPHAALKPTDNDTTGDHPTGTSSPKAKKGQKPKLAKKGQAAQDGTVPTQADRVASARFTGCDLLTECCVRVPLVMDCEKQIEGVTGCWLQLCTGDTPLVDSAELLTRLRPVSFTVHSIDKLPSVPEVARLSTAPSAAPTGESPQTAEDTASAHCSSLHLRVEWGEHRFRVPIRDANSRTSDCDILDDSSCRNVLFLQDVPPFEAYCRAFHEPLQLTLVYTDHSLNQLPMGVGTLPLRDLVTDDQTWFSAAVQLLPQRNTFSTVESCLTAGTTVNVSVDFALPLPPIRHVTESGLPCSQRHFLARAVLIMPYDAPWCEAVLSIMIEQMKQFPRATADVHAYVEPTEVASAENASVVSETAPSSSGPGKAKSERASRRGHQSRPSTPPSVAEAPSPYLAPHIAVVSPCGVSGFEVSDGVVRVFCVEGTVPEVHCILEGAAGAARFDPSLRVLLNSELFVPQRLYLTFPPLVTPPACAEVKVRAPQLPLEPLAATIPKTPESASKYELAEAGGTGGRIHRVRLGQPLEQLMQQQKYLLKRTLSSSCLFAFQCLFEILHCASLKEVMDRALFPSAADVISLERSFGQTLEVFDILGRTEYDATEVVTDPSRTQALAASSGSTVRSAVKAPSAGQTPTDHTTDDDRLTVDLANLQRKDVGHLASFTGTVLAGQARLIPDLVLQRFPKSQWMTREDGVNVLCVFPRSTPTGTIRYHVEGQVVACGDNYVLYALDFYTLAKSWTDTHNAPYEAFLKARTRREKAAMAYGGGGMTLSLRSSHSKEHRSSASRRQRTASSDTSEDDDDALSPPTMRHTSAASSQPKELARRGRRDVVDPKMTRTAQLRAKTAAQSAQPSVSDDVLWALYNERAPKDGSAARGTAADTQQPHVMRF